MEGCSAATSLRRASSPRNGTPPSSARSSPRWPTKGEALYRDHCQGCHLPPRDELQADLAAESPKYFSESDPGRQAVPQAPGDRPQRDRHRPEPGAELLPAGRRRAQAPRTARRPTDRRVRPRHDLGRGRAVPASPRSIRSDKYESDSACSPPATPTRSRTSTA